MSRTTAALVIGVLGDDYGPRADGTLPNMAPYIAAAVSMIDATVACAARKGVTLAGLQVGAGTSSGADTQDTQLEMMERWLAAYYYTKSDPVYSSRSTAGASGSFLRDQEDPNPYRGTAVDLDSSGCLNAILKRWRAGTQWLGKAPSAQVPYNQRD